jgi:c-di-GMP-related signal transduction protein
MRLLGLVLEDAETTQLENVLKPEPGLTINLMRLTNSAATGLRTKITSIRHAITVLGRRQLQRWLQLLLYTNPSGNRVVSPLLQLAASRGRLMELLAAKLHPGRGDFEDTAFMTGIMSLMPTLMSVSLEEILRGIEIPGSVRSALEAHDGELGTMLKLTEALEAATAAPAPTSPTTAGPRRLDHQHLPGAGAGLGQQHRQGERGQCLTKFVVSLLPVGGPPIATTAVPPAPTITTSLPPSL